MSAVKKAAIYLLILCVLAAGIVFWLGSQKYKVTFEQHIDAPPDVVFQHLIEPELIKQWADVVSIEPLTNEGHKVGARAKITVRHDDEEMVFEDEVKESRQNERLLVESDSTMILVNSDYQLENLLNKNKETRIKVVVEMQYKSIFRFLAPFSGRSIDKKVEKEILRLKNLAEENFDRDIVKSDPATYVKPEEDKDESSDSEKSVFGLPKSNSEKSSDKKTNNK